MDGRRLAPVFGIVACLAVVGIVILPYLVVSSEAVGTYYGVSAVGPWLVALFALIAIIVLLAGLQERTDPVTVAGAALVFALVMVVVAALWAATVPTDFVQQLSEDEWLGYHRWALVSASLVVLASTVWNAVELL